MKLLTRKSTKSHITIRTLVALGSALFLFSPSNAMAKYIATGPIKAEDCYDFGIKLCSIKTVTEVRKDGRRYEVGRYYESVSRYKESRGICYIETKSRGAGILSFGINKLVQPDFWGYDSDGKFGKIDADFIFFNCVKR
jgi:hypothetical protein